jgi:hypothetical protein
MAGNFTQLTTIEIELRTPRLRTAQPFAFALAFAFLVVIPEGDLLLPFTKAQIIHSKEFPH